MTKNATTVGTKYAFQTLEQYLGDLSDFCPGTTAYSHVDTNPIVRNAQKFECLERISLGQRFACNSLLQDSYREQEVNL